MRVLILLLAISSTFSLSAQDVRDHWVFGDSMHLHFTDLGLIEAETLPFSSLENSISISDSLGNILFYGNNEKIYNRNGEIMEGGDSLSPKFTSGSATHGVLALEIPGSEHLYVYFYAVYYFASLLPSLAYCIIDMSVGDGIVPVATKGTILLEHLFAEQVGAIRHGNGVDWWIVATIMRDSNYNNEFATFLLTDNGIEFVQEQEIGDDSFVAGELAISNSGDKLARASGYGNGVQIYDFDRCSGLISNPVNLGIDKGYGCAFSNNGKYLYYVMTNTEKLYQVDLETLNTLEIFSGYSDTGISAGQMEMGPDGRMYFTVYKLDLTGNDFYSKHLGVIEYPDSLGLACGFDPLGFGPLSRSNRIGLPNHPNYYLGPLVGSDCDTLSTIDTTTSVSPIPYQVSEECFKVIVDPYSSSLSLSIDPTYLGEVFEVYHISGKRVLVAALESLRIQWPTSDWVPGVYVLRLQNASLGCSAQKWILQQR